MYPLMALSDSLAQTAGTACLTVAIFMLEGSLACISMDHFQETRPLDCIDSGHKRCSPTAIQRIEE
jgi:hypothetical protein